MYIGVPATMPDWVRLASSAARARPKSVILTCWCGPASSRMLAGLMSRWMSPGRGRRPAPRRSAGRSARTSAVSSGPGPVEPLLEGFAGDELHHQVRQRLLLDRVDLHDVLVPHLGRRAGLAQEPLAGGRGGGQLRGQHLDRDHALQRLVEGAGRRCRSRPGRGLRAPRNGRCGRGSRAGSTAARSPASCSSPSVSGSSASVSVGLVHFTPMVPARAGPSRMTGLGVVGR